MHTDTLTTVWIDDVTVYPIVTSVQGIDSTFPLGHGLASCPRATGDALAVDAPVEAAYGAWDEPAWPCPECIAVPLTVSNVQAVNGPNVDAPDNHGGPGRARPAADGPTEAQERFYRSLLADLAAASGIDRPATEFADEMVAAAQEAGKWTKRGVSALIDTTKSSLATLAQAPSSSAAPAHRPNRYAAPCADCGATVAEGAGALTKEGGRWTTRHVDGCPTVDENAAEASLAAAEAQAVTPGMYRHPHDGRIWKVQPARGSGRLYAKRLADGGGFDYDRGAMRLIRAEWRMTLEEAKAFGRATGVCCNCGAELTNPESIEAGIGPICAGKF